MGGGGLAKELLCLSSRRGKFEAVADDMTAEEILEQAQKVHDTVTQKLAARKLKTSVSVTRSWLYKISPSVYCKILAGVPPMS